MAHQHGPWTIKNSEEVFHNEFIRVRQDAVVRPDGRPGHYATVTMPTGVVVLPFDEDGSVYLVRQFRYAAGRHSLEVVSGGQQPGEAALQAAQRELREELGIEAGEWSDLGRLDLDTSIVWSPAYLFLARQLSFIPASSEGTEALRPVKLPLAEAALQVMSSQITHGPSCVLILKAERWLKR